MTVGYESEVSSPVYFYYQGHGKLGLGSRLHWRGSQLCVDWSAIVVTSFFFEIF